MEEREKEDEEIMGLKLKRGILVGKSKVEGRGICTPPPTWKTFQNTNININNNINDNNNNNDDNNNVGFNSDLTARQLGSNLWHILPHLHSISKMNTHCNYTTKNNQGFSIKHQKNQGLGGVVDHNSVDDDVASDNQLVSTGSFHRQIAASLIRHHRVVDRDGCALQPVSPASYCSSMEITPYNHAASTSSSMEYNKGRMFDSSNNLKTSTELLKVLNRIWCLEEQHASTISVTKALKTDLDNAMTRIQELLREKKMDRQVMDGLMKQVSEQKLNRKKIDQDRLQSVRQELEDERKLRKRSESLHRKMGREISEMKASFSKALNELERERHTRILLENLCDEFAMGIRDYEHELRSMKYNRNDNDGLILHISEAWLDERVQMGEMSTAVDKLRPEIEGFLKARQTADHTHNKSTTKGSGLRRGSLESYNLNEATSAPKNADDEESIDSESNCFELNKNIGGEYAEEKDGEYESHVANNDRSNVTGLQARFEKHMARMKLQHEPTNTNRDGLGLGEEELLKRRSKRFGNRGGKSNHLLDNLLRNNSSSLEEERIHPVVSDLPDDDSRGHFSLVGPASPVKKWESKILPQDDPEISESSTGWSKGPRENTLKARLLQARLEGRNLQSRTSKGSA